MLIDIHKQHIDEGNILGALLAAEESEHNRKNIFYYAASVGNQDIVEALVDRGADINLKNSLHLTPLMGACMGGHINTASYLLQAGADTKPGNDRGLTALHLAAYTGNAKSVDLLLHFGADTLARDKKLKTPLHLCKDVCTTKLLVTKGTDINVVDINGNTPLHAYIKKRLYVNCGILLSLNVDVDIPNNKGLTSRQIARESEHEKVIKVFDMYGIHL